MPKESRWPAQWISLLTYIIFILFYIIQNVIFNTEINSIESGADYTKFCSHKIFSKFMTLISTGKFRLFLFPNQT